MYFVFWFRIRREGCQKKKKEKEKILSSWYEQQQHMYCITISSTWLTDLWCWTIDQSMRLFFFSWLNHQQHHHDTSTMWWYLYLISIRFLFGFVFEQTTCTFTVRKSIFFLQQTHRLFTLITYDDYINQIMNFIFLYPSQHTF